MCQLDKLSICIILKSHINLLKGHVTRKDIIYLQPDLKEFSFNLLGIN
jgi:hypothetical protein